MDVRRNLPHRWGNCNHKVRAAGARNGVNAFSHPAGVNPGRPISPRLPSPGRAWANPNANLSGSAMPTREREVANPRRRRARALIRAGTTRRHYENSPCYCKGCLKRRGGDSNPRNGCPFTRFPIAFLQPLGHLSGMKGPSLAAGAPKPSAASTELSSQHTSTPTWARARAAGDRNQGRTGCFKVVLGYVQVGVQVGVQGGVQGGDLYLRGQEQR